MKHDLGWAKDQCSLADRDLLSGLNNLPANPYQWRIKPKNIITSFIYKNWSITYFFIFRKRK